MTNPNPATPAKAATPGSGEPVGTPPSGTTPPGTNNGAGGNDQEGKVTISAKEYADLRRDAARTRSFGSRVYRRPAAPAANADPNDPVAQANARATEAEQRALRLEVQGKVRDLLADERFKEIPQSTKDLILENPHMLSGAETLEDAMYDIEDKLIDIASKTIPVTIKNDITPGAPSNGGTPPANRETPPVITPGAPAAVDDSAMEDVTNLRGVARSQAVLRNSMRKQRMSGKQ